MKERRSSETEILKGVGSAMVGGGRGAGVVLILRWVELLKMVGLISRFMREEKIDWV